MAMSKYKKRIKIIYKEKEKEKKRNKYKKKIEESRINNLRNYWNRKIKQRMKKKNEWTPPPKKKRKW